MLEQYLIKNCSPTLASLKTANLINVPFENYDELISSVSHWNARLSPKGVDLIVLKLCESMALIYVCRKCNLQRDLNSDGVLDFLKLYGYKSTDVDYCINRLSQRLSLSADFPAIRSTMLSVLSAIAVKTANAAAVGKFIVTSARLSRPLLNLKNAQKFIANYGRREEV